MQCLKVGSSSPKSHKPLAFLSKKYTACAENVTCPLPKLETVTSVNPTPWGTCSMIMPERLPPKR